MENAVSEYPYLSQLKSVIDESQSIGKDGQIDQQKLMNILSQYLGQSWFALFEINDAPVNSTETPIITAPTTTSS
jgi:hypothetical protein